MMLLKGTSSKGSNPKYANNVDVKVPNLYPGTNKCKLNEYEEEVNCQFKNEYSWENAYKGYSTRNVIMEERNLFCGAYNVLLLKEKRDPHRVIHFNGTNTIAFGSFDKKLRFIELKSATEKSNTIQGHAGSIKCVYICEAKRVVITGSYDTSIRCWSIDTNKCIKIYQGHQQTVTCLSMYDEHERIISGSGDKTCKVWLLGRKKCWRTFKHLYPISSVAIGEEICISGGVTGKIKVFNLETGNLIKTISAHQGQITALKFDRWHILSCSTDGYAVVFSTQGKHKKGIIAMRHPKEVLCLEFKYLRAITGSADGKIRIWNILNGDCIRVMRGNSRCDPVLSITTIENRILINTEYNVLLMEFEQITYEYGSNKDEANENNLADQQEIMKKTKNYPSIRASRMELVATPNVKLFNDDRKSVMEHSSRPISDKNLKDAHLVHSITSKPTNLPKNAIGNLSESALLKRQSIVQAINDTIVSRTSLSVLSNHRSVSHLNQHNNFFERDDYYESSLNNFPKSSADRSKPSNLQETKLFLREQLNEIKQAQQLSQTNGSDNQDQKLSYKKPTSSDKIETESCVETRVVNRDTIMSKYESVSSTLIRPTSSPSKYDTKTKTKFRTQDYRIKNDDTEKPKTIPNNTPHNHKSQTQIIVSKVFETQESFLKTNDYMYPINVKSKMPNPIIIRPQTVPDKIDEMKNIKFSSQKNRSKTAQAPNNNPNMSSVPFLLGPKLSSTSMINSKSNKKLNLDLNETTEAKSKLASHDNLNLMTHKDVDRIVDTINSYYISPQKSQDVHQTDLFKKIWMLKSTGQYHGSLLMKPSARAPEIRE